MGEVTKLKVAVVDDDPMMLKLVQLMLEQIVDIEIYTYPTGEKLIADLAINKPDILVSDFWLNSKTSDAMSGMELVKKLRLTISDLPVIMISSQKDLEIALELIKLKVVDYLEKSDDFARKVELSVREVISMILLNREIEVTQNSILKDTKHLKRVGVAFLAGVLITLTLLYFNWFI